MKHALEFLDDMVRDVLHFDYKRLQAVAGNTVSIKLLPAAPERALADIMPRVATMFKSKYPRHVRSVVTADRALVLDTGLMKVQIEACYTQVALRGSTCAGALIDTFRMLDTDEQRALHNSMITMRTEGFPAYSVVLPLEL